MIFPTESVETARRELAEKLESGVIEPAQAFAELLSDDPENRVALFELARFSQAAGDYAAAETYARRGLAAHAFDYRFYVQLSGILAAHKGETALAAGLMEIGILKLLGDPHSMEDAERLRRMGKFAGTAVEFSDPASLEPLAADLAVQREHEPPAVSDELFPYRQVHELHEALGNELDRGLVDAILAEGPRCRPLLTSALRGIAEDYLPEGGDLVCEAALALLGEIGDPASMLDLVSFAVVDDKALSDIATWALLRIASRKPAACLAALAGFSRSTGGTERACIAETIATMPPTPGKTEAYLALLENFGMVSEAERTDTFVVVSAALVATLGKQAAAVIRKALAETPGLPADTRPAVDDLLKAYAADPAAFAIEEEGAVPSVYDICCADRIAAYEEEEDTDGEEHVHGPGCDHDHDHEAHAPALPGRNDPCWCGSGRKYKKCHLAQDEATRLGNLPDA